jgi:hypothetical protein
MKKILVMTAGLMLMPLPAFSQSSSDSGDRGSSYGKRGQDVDELLRGLDEDMSGGRPRRGRGFGFLLRHGDSTIAVRCDPSDSMKACVDATTTLLDKARASMPSGGSPGASPGASPGTPPAGSPGTPPSRP